MVRRWCFAFSLKNKMKPVAAAMPTGMLIQKIQAHETELMMSPPNTGPITAAIAQTLARYPCTLPRSRAGYRSATTVIATGCIAPAPTPWMSRHQIMTGMDHANPAKIEPKRKIPIPMSMIGLRQQERRKYPAVETQTTEIRDYLRHRRGHDGCFDGNHGH